MRLCANHSFATWSLDICRSRNSVLRPSEAGNSCHGQPALREGPCEVVAPGIRALLTAISHQTGKRKHVIFSLESIVLDAVGSVVPYRRSSRQPIEIEDEFYY
jgi:hypothetical protein